jgi:hypothetical protein
MRKARNRSLSRRSMEVRERWQLRVSAQRASGIAQTQWCRQNGIEPKYFSLWKGKLAKPATIHATAATGPARLVPVTIRPNVAKAVPPTGLGLTVTLPNGVGLRFEVPSALSVAPLLRELAGLSC